METRHEIRMRVAAGSVETRERPTSDGAAGALGPWAEAGDYRPGGVDDLRRMAAALSAVGLESSVEVGRGGMATLSIRYASPGDAERMAKRGGRRRADLPYGSPLRDLTASEAVAWVDSHTQAEREEAFGVSRASCYRRMRELRDLAKRHPESETWHMRHGRH